MLVCKKCGNQNDDNSKFCDKCGIELDVVQEETVTNDIHEDENVVESRTEGSPLHLVNQIENAVHPFLPHPFTKKGDRTSLMIGLGSFAVLALTYIICFFSFMPEICLPIGITATGVEGASTLWIVAHFAFGLFTVFFAVKAFLTKKYRLYTLFVSVGIFVLTLFALIFWGMCEPSTYTDAMMVYSNSPGSIAWFAFVDCLSEAWYIKFIFSIASVFGFGVDYIINKGN